MDTTTRTSVHLSIRARMSRGWLAWRALDPKNCLLEGARRAVAESRRNTPYHATVLFPPKQSSGTIDQLQFYQQFLAVHAI